jgi:transcriptional regulator of acetoin/glycerol metabolism
MLDTLYNHAIVVNTNQGEIMPGRELAETAAAVTLVTKKGWRVIDAADKYGLTTSTLYMAIKRRDPKWFQKNPLRRQV